MDDDVLQQIQTYVFQRRQHPAWQLLSARSAPVVLACLKFLFADSHNGVPYDTALQLLSEVIASREGDEELGLAGGDSLALARKELRGWIKRGLVVERDGQLLATDALEEALRFADGLDDRIMTSTASRLSIVQREIENLESSLNPDPASRVVLIKRKLALLEKELEEAQAGNISVLSEAEAVEGIREIFNLATSLRADFRRVEDSYREADQKLRQSILSENQHRGSIVDSLLDGHDTLLETAEGRVFYGFQQQLRRSLELETMKRQLGSIVRHPVTGKALTLAQCNELRWLIMRLVKESETVIRARARSERDVRGFLKTGLAAEHHRVGELLKEILQRALDIDWGSQHVRRSDGPLPPIALANPGLSLVERLRFKSLAQDDETVLDLSNQGASLDEVEEDFWNSFDSLDRRALAEQTLALLRGRAEPADIALLAEHFQPAHDLETIALWLSMAREADAPISDELQAVEVVGSEGQRIRFQVPIVELSASLLEGIDWEL